MPQRGCRMRLNKYLAQCGVCSRRDADKLIEQGKVLVNGQVAEMGQQVEETDTVQVGKKVLQGKQTCKVLAFYKPVGVVCTERDPHAEKKIMDMIRCPERLTYAGRLDKDSEGLILLTNDGDLINAMMRGANRHEKEYIVKIDREITPDFLEIMRKGIYLKDLDRKNRKIYIPDHTDSGSQQTDPPNVRSLRSESEILKKNPRHEYPPGRSEARRVAQGHRGRAGNASDRHRNVKS